MPVPLRKQSGMANSSRPFDLGLNKRSYAGRTPYCRVLALPSELARLKYPMAIRLEKAYWRGFNHSFGGRKGIEWSLCGLIDKVRH